MAVVTMRELLDAGVHFGHQTRRWNPKMKRFIFTDRNGIYIIDLQQTLTYIDKAFEFVKETVAHGGTILFVGTKKQAQEAVKNEAERVGMPYVNHRWLGGMLTNFQTVSKSLSRMKELQAMDAAENGYEGRTKKEILMLTRERTKLERVLGGIADMSKIPSALWIIDTNKEHIAVSEAQKLNIPVVAILDTNCDPDVVDYPIPGNDDAIRSTGLLSRLISTAVAEGKKARSERELAARRDLGVKTFQAEDEIGGICTALGASYAGSLAATSTSGPGLALKSEALGLAVIAELPLVLIDVMRGGPSTGLPTKTEQTDLLQALYGRNGESPLVVMAASSPDDCFYYAYMASKIALENLTPVILLTDAFIGNGASLWKLPKLSDMPEIKPHYAPESLKDNFNGLSRDEQTKIRYWAIPSTEGFEHRVGGLERNYNTGVISTEGANHAKMVATRAFKVQNIAKQLPLLEVEGDASADTLVIGWGSTRGHLQSAVAELNKRGKRTAHLHFNYINPLPSNAEELIRRYKKVIVCELNSGQFAGYLRSKIHGVDFLQVNKIEGQPFSIEELVEHIEKL